MEIELRAPDSSPAQPGQVMRREAGVSHSGGERDVLSTGEWQLVDTELGLTARESEIVELVLADLKESAMGAELGISPHTVHTHLERVYRKVGVRGRVQLVVRVLGACLAHMRGVAGFGKPAEADREALSPQQATFDRE